MKILKRALIVLGSLIVLFVIAFGVYLFVNIQDVAEAFEVGSPDSSRKILIASQGSEYKNLMVDTLISRLKGEDVYIRVMDISGLKEVDQKDWDAEIIIHTTEGYRLPEVVKEYLERIEDTYEVMLLVTSGSGKWKPEDCKVDVLTSASKITDIAVKANIIENKIESVFE
jgi:hypothetical protein